MTEFEIAFRLAAPRRTATGLAHQSMRVSTCPQIDPRHTRSSCAATNPARSATAPEQTLRIPRPTTESGAERGTSSRRQRQLREHRARALHRPADGARTGRTWGSAKTGLASPDEGASFVALLLAGAAGRLRDVSTCAADSGFSPTGCPWYRIDRNRPPRPFSRLEYLSPFSHNEARGLEVLSWLYVT
jgi:hypothetical protein